MWLAIIKGIEGVSKIKGGYNPATWMLEVTTSAQEFLLGVDFTEIYKNSDLYRWFNYRLSESIMILKCHVYTSQCSSCKLELVIEAFSDVAYVSGETKI